MDLKEAEDIKMRWQEYTENSIKRIFMAQIITMVLSLTQSILEWEVKWALGGITANKTSGGDGIPVELFQILKDNAMKMFHSICQQIWKTQQWPQDWKSQFSFQSQRKAVPKNALTIVQLHSSHTLVK